jgi:hypothetical protein
MYREPVSAKMLTMAEKMATPPKDGRHVFRASETSVLSSLGLDACFI